MSDRFTEEKQSVPIDVQQIKKEREIYKDLKPGSFLYEYRSKLNDSLKMKPSIRAKQLAEISEDLEEVKKEIFHLERSREKLGT